MLLSRLLLLSALLSFTLSFAGSITRVKTNVYVISIGINDYKQPFSSLRNAVNDAQMIANKIRLDNNAKAQFDQSTEQIIA